MMLRLILLLLASIFCIPAWSDDVMEKVIADIRQDIEHSIKSLNARRQAITTEKTELLKKVNTLEKQNAEVLAQCSDLKKAEALKKNSLQANREKLAGQQRELEQIHLASLDFRRSFEMTMTCLDAGIYAQGMKGLDERLALSAESTLPAATAELLGKMLEFCQLHTHPAFKKGAVRDADGHECIGVYAHMGPIVLFSNGRDRHGLVLQGGRTFPQLHEDLSGKDKAQLQAFFAGQGGIVPVDVSGEKIMRIQAGQKSFVDTLIAGGVVMIPIILIGLIGVILIIIKFMALGKIKIDFDRRLRETMDCIQQGQWEQASTQLKKSGYDFSGILLEGIAHRAQSAELVEELMFDKMALSLPGLEKHIGLLAVFAAVAPLLGLLGTVTGMIQTFQTMTVYGSGNAKMLSGGIAEALITTAGGLIVAIPIMLCHALLNRRVKRIVQEWQRCIMVFVSHSSMKKS